VKPPVKARRTPVRVLGLSETVARILLVLLGTAMILFGKMLRVLIVGCAREILYSTLGFRCGPSLGFFRHRHYISWNQKEETLRDQYTLGGSKELTALRRRYYRQSTVFKLPMGNR